MREDWPYITPGIPDAGFQRAAKVPMTKEEVRVLTLAKARLAPGQVVYDVGAGTGSLTVEAARLVAPGRVYAVERDPAALAVAQANVDYFGLANVALVGGEAPAALAGWPAPDRVLVGGSGGALEGILLTCLQVLKPAGRMVVNAVTMETLQASLDFARREGLETEVICANIARLRAVAGRQLWQALNPVYIITLTR